MNLGRDEAPAKSIGRSGDWLAILLRELRKNLQVSWASLARHRRLNRGAVKKLQRPLEWEGERPCEPLRV